MYGSAEHMSGWGYAFMTITMVALWRLVIIALVALVRSQRLWRSSTSGISCSSLSERRLWGFFWPGTAASGGIVTCTTSDWMRALPSSTDAYPPKHSMSAASDRSTNAPPLALDGGTGSP